MIQVDKEYSIEVAVNTIKEIEIQMLKTVWSLQERGVIGNVQS